MDINIKKVECIYNKGKNAIGKRIRELLNDIEISQNISYKGQIGNIIQEHLFGIETNSKSAPDFEDLGIELKVIPVKKTAKSNLTPKERMVMSMIKYDTIVNEVFEKSLFMQKNKFLLVIAYEYLKDIDKLDYKIIGCTLINLEKIPQYKIIKSDWEIIKNKVIQGKAQELSESDTSILAATTKAANSKILTNQPNSEIKAKPRAFSFKPNFLTYFIKQIEKKVNADYIKELFENSAEIDYIQNYDFEEILNYLKKLIGKDIKEHKYYKKTKQQYRQAIFNYIKFDNFKMFNFINESDINIFCKYTKSGKIIEQIGTNVNINPTDIINQDFEESDLYNKVVIRKHIIIGIDKETFKIDSLYKFIFDNNKIEKARKVYINTKNEIKRLIILNKKESLKENFTKLSDDLVIHIRPHAKNKGDVYKNKNIIVLNITKRQYWINKKELIKVA